MIAAYNEAGVIGRTLESILASDYPDLEIIVVDDGSTDGTAKVVEEIALGNPRIRLLVQPNGGKASALDNALSVARGEVCVGFDADTQVVPGAISLLVRHFCNPRVGAVAGNVKVGNQVNVLTCWQAIEYVTTQNLDRRAYGLLNAISVVPGAIGAWRRSAVAEVGGYEPDTLAEDMDLTWRLRRKGWRIVNETEACAYTEAPDTFRTLFKQRFRWAWHVAVPLETSRRARPLRLVRAAHPARHRHLPVRLAVARALRRSADVLRAEFDRVFVAALGPEWRRLARRRHHPALSAKDRLLLRPFLRRRTERSGAGGAARSRAALAAVVAFLAALHLSPDAVRGDLESDLDGDRRVAPGLGQVRA